MLQPKHPSRRFGRQLAELLGVCALWLNLLLNTVHCAEPTNRVADGELRACQAVTVDHGWAVGDRGLILATSDAGKNWVVQHARSIYTHHAVCFANENVGWVLGGAVEPYSNRSVGVVLTTQDSGRNWQTLASDLPRIVGAQLIGPNHLLAWGDWSNVYQSAIFESTDGGQSWNARPSPSSHVQCAASGPNSMLVLIDRTGRSFRTTDGLEYQPAGLPQNPFDPIRFCKFIDGTWWAGGDAGSLFRSSDAVQWQSVALPGTAADRTLYSLRDLAGHGSLVWIVGQPGNVIWTSDNLGDTWSIRTMNRSSCNNAISALNSDVLMTCGPFASVYASRNGGKAWWSQHQSGTRDAVLNISSTASNAAWDLLTHITHDYKRNASLLVLHDQSFEERTGHSAELAARCDVAGKTIGLAQSRILPNSPVSYLYSGVRASDLEYYVQNTSTDSQQDTPLLLRRLVLEIRSSRPDLIVAPCQLTGDALESKTAIAIDQAMRLAGQKSFRVFSQASGIQEEAWQPQRILSRGTRPGLQYSSAMILKASSTVMGAALAQVKPILLGHETTPQVEARYSYSIAGSKGGTIREPLEGILLDSATQMNEKGKSISRLSALMGTCQWFDWKQVLDSEFGNPLTPDRVWESKLKSIAKSTSAETVAPVLLDIAVHSRRTGQWNRWFAALELLLEYETNTPAAEAAYWEMMRFTGSKEVQQVIADQYQRLEKRVSREENATAATLQQSSPFAKSPRENGPVQPVSFSNSVRRIPIATNRDLDEFSRLLAKWPDAFQSRRSDQRWGWLISSRYRSLQQRTDGAVTSQNPKYSMFWPPQSGQLSSWSNVAGSERWLANSDAKSFDGQPSPIVPLAMAGKKPFLDGKADEAFWNEATTIELRDPWSAGTNTRTQLKLACDDEFLYIFSTASCSATSQSGRPNDGITRASLSDKTTQDTDKRHDRLPLDCDHFKLRIDTDRDYASWFELGWSSSRETNDSCNDMSHWNPTWYVETTKSPTSWSAEIAIPLAELVQLDDTSKLDWTNQVWAINAVHCIPSLSTESIAPNIADRMTTDSWVLIAPPPPVEAIALGK